MATTDHKPIDIVVADTLSGRLIAEDNIKCIMKDLDVNYELCLENDDVSPGYYLEDVPQDAIVYAHSSLSSRNAFFSMALRMSGYRPDLKFILRIRDAYTAGDFQDRNAYETYQELAQHLPHPSKSVSISSMEVGDFFSLSEAGEGYFKHYVMEYMKLRVIE